MKAVRFHPEAEFYSFGVLFRERSDEIVIMAVMHLHRDPEYWKNR